MRNRSLLNIIKRTTASALVSALFVSGIFSTPVFAATGDKLKDKYTGFEGVTIDWKYGSASEGSYRQYLSDYSESDYAPEDVTVDIRNAKDVNGSSLGVISFEGMDAVLTDKKSEYALFKAEVPADGLYRLELTYYLDPSSTDPGKRIIYIDGKAPFTECADIKLPRFFKDAGEPVVNSIGDETRPQQEAINGWRTACVEDTSGKYEEPFSFYLTKGTHEIQLIYNKVDIYIGGVTLKAPKVLPSYDEVLSEYNYNGYKEASVDKITFQAELNTLEKNDVTLRRDNDGDPLVQPASSVNRLLNVMGGYRWRNGNQSITWEFEVPKTGLYKLGCYFKQNWNDGLASTRQIAIDGEVPFKELLLYKFNYDTSWHFETFHAADGKPFFFYLEEGKHTITMTVKMGDMGPILDSIMDDISVLSDMLLKITMLATDSPDPNYDYRFFEKIPELPGQMQYLIDSMDRKYELASALATKTPAMANNFMTVKAQIKSMLNDPFSIAKKMGDLTGSQESLSNWYLTLQTNPLVIDRFEVGSPSEVWKDKSSNIFQKVGATMTQFFSSFTKDYDNVGGVLAEDVVVTDTINVWIARGTEWAEVIKEMADATFTPETGIAINVNVLPASQLNAGNVNALMLSITSGKAPDVALGVDITSPVEFAIRDQVYDLSKMEGFAEVKERFVPATLTPYEYMGGTFAIPETMNFNVLYYRKDILAQNGIDLPETREDLYDYVLPALYQHRLEFYFARDFTQFLFQNGGEFYTEDGMRSALDTPEAYQAFKEYTELFTNYGVPKTANFYQRLRSGISALGVGDFNTYMQLSVAAPEISGKWGIAPLPGVMKEDGTIDRSAGAITEKGDIIMKQSKKPEQSWKFLKWWSSAEVQSTFAKEVEALMGAESRWNTANKEAFLSLDWDDEDIATLEEQWKWAKETPVLLGSYMTTRHLTNAWTTVVISGGNVREALEQAVKDINREMRSKQEEYGVIADGE